MWALWSALNDLIEWSRIVLNLRVMSWKFNGHESQSRKIFGLLFGFNSLVKTLLVYHYLMVAIELFVPISLVKISDSQLKNKTTVASEVNIWFVSLNPILSPKHLLHQAFFCSNLFRWFLTLPEICASNPNTTNEKKNCSLFSLCFFLFSLVSPLIYTKKIAHAFFLLIFRLPENWHSQHFR